MTPPDPDLPTGHQAFVDRCAALAEDPALTAVFSRPAGEIAAALDTVAALRATALHWDGRHAFALAGDVRSPVLRDRRLLAAAAVDAVDEVLLAVERAWLAVPEEAAARLLDEPALLPYRHYLAGVRSLAPYGLGADAESALAAREYAANTAWVELYYQVTGALEPVVDGERLSMERARSALELDDGGRRERSLEALYTALDPVVGVLSHSLDTLVSDRLALDATRGLPHPRAERDLTNELPSVVVDDLLDTIEEVYPLAQRWFARKAQLLGTDRLGYAHLRAPLGTVPHIPYATAVRAATEAFDALDPDAGRMVRDLVAGGYVDAEPRPGKQPGAWCRSLGPGRAPRILLSYFGTVEDVVGLAHELGHALQFTLAGRRHNGLTFDAPLILNEIAPAFTELLVQDWLLDHESDPDRRRLLAAKRVDSAVEAVFMSTFLTRFELRIHELRRSGSALTPERIEAVWAECGAAFYGPHVTLPTRWGRHWMLVPHVIHERFYSYTYAFARLLGLDFHARYRSDPDGFRPRLLELLGRGGTAGPVEQLAGIGIDVTDRALWRSGLAHLAALMDQVDRTDSSS